MRFSLQISFLLGLLVVFGTGCGGLGHQQDEEQKELMQVSKLPSVVSPTLTLPVTEVSPTLIPAVEEESEVIVFREKDGLRVLKFDLSQFDGNELDQASIQSSTLLNNTKEAHDFAVSPDGTELAYSRYQRLTIIDLTQPNLPVKESISTVDFNESIEMRFMRDHHTDICGLKWIRNEIIYIVGKRSREESYCSSTKLALFFWSREESQLRGLYPEALEIIDYSIVEDRVYFTTFNGFYRGDIHNNIQLMEEYDYVEGDRLDGGDGSKKLVQKHFRIGRPRLFEALIVDSRYLQFQEEVIDDDGVSIWFQNEERVVDLPIPSPDFSKFAYSRQWCGFGSPSHPVGLCGNEFYIQDIAEFYERKRSLVQDFRGDNTVLGWDKDSESLFFIQREFRSCEEDCPPQVKLFRIDTNGAILEEHIISLNGGSSIVDIKEIGEEAFVWHFCAERLENTLCRREVWVYSNGVPYLLYEYQKQR